MKTTISRLSHESRLGFIAFLAAAAIVSQVARSQEATHTMATIPVIQLDHVPLLDAIKNMARQTGQNFILDPRLSEPWAGPDGQPAREPSITVRWENLTAEQALGRLLKENGLTMVANPATSIARITFTNQTVTPLPASQLGSGTNAVIPLVVMEAVPFAVAIKNLASQAHLDLTLDPALPVPSTGPVPRTVSECPVSLRWQNVTARQAIAALLDNYGLALALDPVGHGSTVVAQPAGSARETPRPPLSAEAQAVLDDLNLKCASAAWSSEFEAIERPQTTPPNHVISGEVSAFLADCKKRLAALGYQVNWIPEKKMYAVEKGAPGRP